MKNIAEIDKNFKNQSAVREDMKLYDIREQPFDIYGLYRPCDEGKFRRLPVDVAKQASEGAFHLSTHTSGGRVRFRTDSKYIILKVVLPSFHVMPHMPLSGSAGFDLYVGTDYFGSFIPHFEYDGFEPVIKANGGYERILEFPDAKMRDITINFPLYNDVSDVFIGLSEKASLERGAEYKIKTPVVFYGSSITQGGCASRPGCIYQNILSRRFDFDYINLGLSGNARAEECIADYVAGLDMSVFVYDYDHNAPNPEHLRKTHYAMYKKVRDAHPDIPIIMLSRPNNSEFSEIEERINIILDTFNRAKSEGDNNIYFINGQDIFNNYNKDIFNVDGCHPNDFGFSCMAAEIGKVMEKII